MAKNEFNATLVDALQGMVRAPELGSGTGTLRFTRPDKKTIGTVALRSGKIEALEVTRHPNYILQRALNSGLVSDTNRDMLLNTFKNNQESPLIVDYLRQYMILPEQTIVAFVKEHFLGVLDEMFTWHAVKGEWKPGAGDRVLTMPFVSPDKLLDLGRKRATFLQTIADDYTIEVDQLDGLKFKRVGDVTDADSDTANILRLGSGEYTAYDIYRQVGIIPFNANRELYQLWLDKAVDMVYADQFPLSRPEELREETRDAAQAEVSAEAALTPTHPNPTQPPVAPAPQAEQDEEPVTDATFEDDEIFAADELEESASVPVAVPVAIPKAIVTPPTTATVTPVSPQTPAKTGPEGEGLSASVKDFLAAVTDMKYATQASWDEVVARDEAISKTEQTITEQQGYLAQLRTEREAWNEDFETKRADYENTVAVLREHL